MKFWKSLFGDILTVGTCYFCYKYAGFELAIIITLGLILSNLIKLNYKPKIKPPAKFYTTNTRKFKP